MEKQPKATLFPLHESQALTSAVSNPKATATYHASSALLSTATSNITPKAPTPLATTQAWSMPNATNAQHATGHRNHTVTNPEALTFTYPHSHTTHISPNANLGGGIAKVPVTTSTKQKSRHAAIEISTASLPTATILSFNATASNNGPLNHTNTTTITWTLPCSMMTTTPTPMPKPRDKAFRHFINNINSALPYLEACGLLVIVWNVGKFIQAKIQRCRRKRSGLPVNEET